MAHVDLANSLLKTRQFNPAIQEYEEALRLEPAEPITHYNFGVALEAAGDKARARQEYETYLQLDPTAPDSIELRKHLHELAAKK